MGRETRRQVQHRVADHGDPRSGGLPWRAHATQEVGQGLWHRDVCAEVGAGTGIFWYKDEGAALRSGKVWSG